MKKKLLFSRPLVEGLIRSRPNRFIMEVELDGE
jgi:DNA-binding sugar fermentation-stimulating protein